VWLCDLKTLCSVQGWISVVVAKQHYYHGLAQYRMGCVARDDKSFGQSIARMQVSLICYIYKENNAGLASS